MTTSGLTNRPSGARLGDSLLLPGMWVEVLPATEIVSTLDADQSLDGLPFMPEMLPYCGQRFRVAVRAERTCVHPPDRTLRKMAGAVVLEGLRCDGSLHGGCQLGCMLFWKEAWLRAAPAGRPVVSPAEPDPAPELRVANRSDPYVCQATALREATTPGDPLWKPGQYLRFLKVRTFSLSGLLAMFARAGGRKVAWQFRSLRHRDATTGARREAALGLRPGEWVEVKSRDEILRTLDARRMHGGSPSVAICMSNAVGG